MQAVGTTHVGLAAFFTSPSGWPRLHWKRSQPATVMLSTNGVSEAVHLCGIAIILADGGVMRVGIQLVIAQRRIGAGDEDGDLFGIPARCWDRVEQPRPALHGEIARLEVNGQD